MAPRHPEDEARLGRVEAEVASVRERLARLEAGMDAHEKAAVDRHREVLAALDALRARQEAVEARAWKLALALAALGLGGGAGAVELFRSTLGS